MDRPIFHTHIGTFGALPPSSTVFVIEDDDAARHSIAAALEAIGCMVHAFPSCEAFLAHVEDLPDGCLLLDYHFLKGLSGLDLLDRLREDGIFIPTVLFTGLFGTMLKKRAVDYPEVVAVLDKPLSGRPLVDALRKAIDLI